MLVSDLYILTIVFFLAVWGQAWRKFRDPFHPLIFLMPQFAFLYGFMPYSLYREDPQRFLLWVGGDDVYRYQSISIGLVLCLVAGVSYGSRRLTRSKVRWQTVQLHGEKAIRLVGLALGLVGWVAWLYIVRASGGFEGAYGSAYGGGWVPNGYIREMRFVGLGGALLIFLPRVGRGMRLLDWLMVAMCVAPTLSHAILGARRGPALLSLVVLVGGYIYFMRKRVSVILVAGGGMLAGSLMLFLVANRNSLYLGSKAVNFSSPLEHMNRWVSNEYLIGGAAVRYADQYGAFYGARELIWLIGRFLPRSVWPDVYVQLPQLLGVEVDLRKNGGVSREGIASVANFEPSVGAAEAFTGSLWMEFGAASFIVAFLIGLFYVRVWKAARSSISARLIYLFMVALSVYLVMQSIDPWLYRLILFGLPVVLVARILDRRGGRLSRTAVVGRSRESQVYTSPLKPDFRFTYERIEDE